MAQQLSPEELASFKELLISDKFKPAVTHFTNTCSSVYGSGLKVAQPENNTQSSITKHIVKKFLG